MLVDSLRLGFLDVDAALKQFAEIEQRSACGFALRFIDERKLESPQWHLANRELQEFNYTTAGKLNE